jgi:glycolate oxidase FAD binding subunit
MFAAASEREVTDAVRAARADKAPLEIVAGGTRRSVGRPLSLPLLDVSGLAGIVRYEPEELTISALPATPLAEIAAVLAGKGQRLGFDPVDWSRVLGSKGVATLGGATACDASGAGKVRHGGARDSLLGFRAVNGLGEAFRAGAAVVKNVTGFDLPKLMCGAYGTLAVLTELTFRVYPKPAHHMTLCLAGVTPEAGFAALRKIARSALEPAGLAYLPAAVIEGLLPDVGGQGAALIKLEGAHAPLEEKIALAHGLLGGDIIRIAEDPFAAIGNGSRFAAIPGDVWRLFIAPSEAPRLIKELNMAHWLGDWAGGVVWLAARPQDAGAIRAAVAKLGGQAMLLRASAESRAMHGLFAAQSPALAALNRAVKAAFDPLSLFNPGRLW